MIHMYCNVLFYINVDFNTFARIVPSKYYYDDLFLFEKVSLVQLNARCLEDFQNLF